MSKPRRVPKICLKFLIVSVMIILFSSLYTNSVFAGVSLRVNANSSSRNYPTPPLILGTLTNNSIMNASSLNASPQSIINNMRNSNETLPILGKEPQILPNKNYIFSANKSEISVVSAIQPQFIADSGSSYAPSSLLDTGTNTSVMNVSSLNSSPQSIINNMRNSNETLPVPGKLPQILPNKNYIFSANKSEISTPSNNSHMGEFAKGVRIAVVMPTFTAAAYDHSFYVFYNKYINVTQGVNITKDLNLLSNKVTNKPSLSASGIAMLYLLGNLKWVRPEANIAFLTDQDVDEGSVFQVNGSNAYDVIILGHQEYVTQREYDNFKQFVGSGGTMIILDGNVFYAEVKYNNNTDTITLVKGHSWAFNGKSAWRSVNERWENETAQWVGSNYISDISKFSNNPFAYLPHEEQYITNPKDIILLNYNATISPSTNRTGSIVVATYELNYLKGKVIALGLYSDDIIVNGAFDRYFDNLILQYAVRTQD
jgi:N,N-dimethylformamidase beta subunit-like, C-terminal